MLGACSINKVILMGRLTSDPELRQTPNGVSTCQFTVAVTRGYTRFHQRCGMETDCGICVPLFQ